MNLAGAAAKAFLDGRRSGELVEQWLRAQHVLDALILSAAESEAPHTKTGPILVAIDRAEELLEETYRDMRGRYALQREQVELVRGGSGGA